MLMIELPQGIKHTFFTPLPQGITPNVGLALGHYLIFHNCALGH